MYKWFKYKFLPGGKFAQRPVLYVDGDESFTKRGIEMVIGEEISMPRENHYDFYKKFNAIDKFVKDNSIINNGEAQVIIQDEDGFSAWIISKVPEKQHTWLFLIVNIRQNELQCLMKTTKVTQKLCTEILFLIKRLICRQITQLSKNTILMMTNL